MTVLLFPSMIDLTLNPLPVNQPLRLLPYLQADVLQPLIIHVYLIQHLLMFLEVELHLSVHLPDRNLGEVARGGLFDAQVRG